MRTKSKSLEEINAEKAFATHQRIVEREKKMRELKMENIVDYDDMYQSQGYRVVMGDQGASWSSYLSQVDVYRSRSEINAWTKLYERLCVEYGFSKDILVDIPIGRLVAVAVLATSKDDAQEMITLARGASTVDWKEEINKRKGKPMPEDGHQHNFAHLAVCEKCGFKKKE